MYMSYVLDHKQTNDDLSYLLVTDADVKFRYHDVMALLTSMSSDPSIGGKCFGRNSLFLPHLLVLNNRKPLFLPRFSDICLSFFFHLRGRYWPK